MSIESTVEQVEIERSFIMADDFNPMAIEAFKNCEKLLIVNNYSKVNKIRIRRQKDVNTGVTEYIKTYKTFISHGVNKENESKISHKNYVDFVCESNTFGISKTRYTKEYDGYHYCFDVFDYPVWKLCKLEIEKISDEVNLERDRKDLFSYVLPEEISVNVVKDVTDNKDYSNFNMAKMLNGIF